MHAPWPRRCPVVCPAAERSRRAAARATIATVIATVPGRRLAWFKQLTAEPRQFLSGYFGLVGGGESPVTFPPPVAGCPPPGCPGVPLTVTPPVA